MRYKKIFLSLSTIFPFFGVTSSLLSCASLSSNVEQSKPDGAENKPNIEGDQQISFETYSEQEKIFFGEKSIPNKNEIYTFNKQLKDFKTKLNVMDQTSVEKFYTEINSILRQSFNERVYIIKNIKDKVLNDLISFQDAFNEFNQYVLDKRFIASDWIQIMNISKERFIAEARHTQSLSEKNIGDHASVIENIWIKNNEIINKDYLKLADFLNTFGFIDLIYKYQYELAIYPFLYEKQFNQIYGNYLESLDSKNQYDNDPIVIFYRTYKEISLINDCLNWYGISPTTSNSFWYNWILSVKHILDESYEKSAIKLNGDFMSWKPGDWDRVADKRINENEIKNYLPSEIKKQGQNAVDKYIKELIHIIEGTVGDMSDQQRLIMLNDVFKKICFAIEFNAYKSNFFLQKYIFSTDIKLKNVFNNSLFNVDMSIKQTNEILNSNLDDEKISGLFFMGEKPANGSSVLTEEEVIKNLEYLENQYQVESEASNMHKIYLANKYIREFDLFKEIYFELSIFPYLFERVVGYKYASWFQGSNVSNSKWSYLYKDYLMEKYLLYRDWNIYYNKYKYKAKTDRVKYFEKSTLESNWYNWFLEVDFKYHFYTFTGLVPEK